MIVGGIFRPYSKWWEGWMDFQPFPTVPTHRFFSKELPVSILRSWMCWISITSRRQWVLGGLVANFSKGNTGGKWKLHTKARFWMMSLWLLVSFEWRMLFGWDSQSCSNKKLASGMYWWFRTAKWFAKRVFFVGSELVKSNMLCKPKWATGLWYECSIFLVISMQGEQPSSLPMEYRKCLGMVSHEGFWDSHLRSQRHGCGEMSFQFSNGVKCKLLVEGSVMSISWN